MMAQVLRGSSSCRVIENVVKEGIKINSSEVYLPSRNLYMLFMFLTYS